MVLCFECGLRISNGSCRHGTVADLQATRDALCRYYDECERITRAVLQLRGP